MKFNFKCTSQCEDHTLKFKLDWSDGGLKLEFIVDVVIGAVLFCYMLFLLLFYFILFACLKFMLIINNMSEKGTETGSSVSFPVKLAQAQGKYSGFLGHKKIKHSN